MDRYRTRRFARSGIFAVLVLALGLLLAAPGAALAEGSEWARFTLSDPDVQFGRSITFSLSADSQRDVARVWLVYRLDGERARNRALAEFSSGSQVEAEYEWSLESGMMAPGVTIYYRWELQDESGERVGSGEHSFRYEDGRFEWQSVTDGDLTVYHYRDAGQAEEVLDAGTTALERIADGTGMRPLRPIRLYVYATQRDMSGAIPSRSETYDSRTVTLGMSMGSDALVLLGSDGDILETTAHELSHAVVNQNTDSPFADLPRWLDEGLAMYSEGKIPTDNARALNRAISQGTLISLRAMTSYPGDAALVDLYYGQAYSIAAYMIEEYGPDPMHELLASLAAGTPVDGALTEAYGFGLEGLEDGWLESIGVAEPAREAA